MAELRATYRLQLGPGLDFARVRELVPYFRDLGISHLYLSPTLQARSGSTHGYDVVDPTKVSEALGGEDGLRALADEGLGLILDVVPNHMGTGDENRWWADEDERARVFDLDPETGFHRRFFDIDELAGVRIEDPEVFELVSGKMLELVADGVADGLRIDHPDGLADPAQYLERLRDRGVDRVWVEKILAAEPPEPLRDWPVSGTVGYEFLNDVQGLFVDPAGELPLTALHDELTGDGRPFEEIAHEAQLEQAQGPFAREVSRVRAIHDPGDLEEKLAALPVYRTYVRDGEVTDEDRVALEHAGMPGLFEGAPEEFVVRFQQTSPPVMAKGVEDTALYRHIRLLALNDVGGEPGRWGLSVVGFHERCAERARRFPQGLLVTQTHDTKRSGDVRARIGALSGMAAEWEEHVRRWFALTTDLAGEAGPDSQERYLVFQTLVGAWPIDAERIEAYLEKALREAKRTTNWIEPDEDHEAAVKAFATGLLEHRAFLEDFEPFAERVAQDGERSALGQLLLKLTVPGVPDVYQGDELTDLSLVDPDNRRPVDWAERREALDRLRDGGEPGPRERKLDLIVRALRLRAELPAAFAGGTYRALDAGPDVCAFSRGDDDEVLVVVVLREPGRDATVTVPAGSWTSVLADGTQHDLGDAVPVRGLVGDGDLALLRRA